MVNTRELLEKLESDMAQRNHQPVLDAIDNAAHNGLSQNDLGLLFHSACQYFDGPFLRQFLSRHPDLLGQNRFGWTAAHVLVYLGKIEGIDILGQYSIDTGNNVGFDSATGTVMKGLLPHVTDDEQYPKQTPLQFARMMGKDDCAKKIEEYLTIFRQRAQAQQNVVQPPVAALNVASNPVQTTNTVTPAVSINNSAASSATPVIPNNNTAVDEAELLAYESRKAARAAELLKNMEIHDACQSFAIDKFKVLLLLGRNPVFQNGNGWTPIHLAAYLNNLEVIDALGEYAIQTGKNVGLMTGSAKVMAFLQPSVTTDQVGKTPAYLAQLMGHAEAAKKIQEYHIRFQKKISGQDEESIKMMSELSVDKFIEHPLRKDTGCEPYPYTRLSHQVPLTTLYGHKYQIPRTPFFHPYNPNGSAYENQTAFAGCPANVVAVRFPKDAIQYLPVSIKTVIQNEQLDPNKIDLFFVAQNMPWKNEVLLLRAHYWAHGDPSLDQSIMDGTFNMDTPTRVGIFSSTTVDITCDNAKDLLAANPISNSSHAGRHALNPDLATIASPPGVGVLRGIDFERTDSFYSVVKTANGYAAITLHWMLNPDDQAFLSEISQRAQDLKDLIVVIARLKNSRLAMPDGPLSHLTALLNTKVHLDQNNRADYYVRFLEAKLNLEKLTEQERVLKFASKQAPSPTLTLQHNMMQNQLQIEQFKKDLVENTNIMKAAIVQLKTTINNQLTRIAQIPEAMAELNVESYSMGIQAEQLYKEALTIIEGMDKVLLAFPNLTDFHEMQINHKKFECMSDEVRSLTGLGGDFITAIDSALKKIRNPQPNI